MKKNSTLLITTMMLLGTSAALAAPPKKPKSPESGGPTLVPRPGSPLEEGQLTAPGEAGAEEVDVSGIKQKYWARGEENELGVVQNRLYSKAKRVELSAFYALPSSDPFLAMTSYGGSLSYHFNEYFSLSGIGWKYNVRDSTAQQAFVTSVGARSNSNPPTRYFGLEGNASLLYGKLSFIGRKIIYYDLAFSAGLGQTGTLNGDYLTPSVGVGQRFYITQRLSLRIDYRLHSFKEDIIDRTTISRFNQKIGERTNNTSTIFFGLSFLIGKDPQATPEKKP
jgi:outer membrane beta-barrel protein